MLSSLRSHDKSTQQHSRNQCHADAGAPLHAVCKSLCWASAFVLSCFMGLGSVHACLKPSCSMPPNDYSLLCKLSCMFEMCMCPLFISLACGWHLLHATRLQHEACNTKLAWRISMWLVRAQLYFCKSCQHACLVYI